MNSSYVAQNHVSHSIFSGVLTAIATPFISHSSKIDFESFRKLLKSQKLSGISGVVVCGTTGESPTLSNSEKKELVEAALEFQSESFSVYVGTGSNSTAQTIEDTNFYSSLVSLSGQKVRGAMVVCPYYNKPNDSGLLAHFSAVAKSCPNIKLCLYNVPGRTGSNLLPHVAVKLFTLFKNIVAIKEAAGNIIAIQELHSELLKAGIRKDVNVLSGDDATFAAAMLYGANGVISVSTHVAPIGMVKLWNYAQEGNWNQVSEIALQLAELNNNLFCVANPVPLKWFLKELGFGENSLRLPLVPLEDTYVPKVRKVLDSLNKNFPGYLPLK